jgi:hypothetical protein
MLIPEGVPELAPDGVSFKVNVSRVQGQRATAKFKGSVYLEIFLCFFRKSYIISALKSRQLAHTCEGKEQLLRSVEGNAPASADCLIML